MYWATPHDLAGCCCCIKGAIHHQRRLSFTNWLMKMDFEKKSIEDVGKWLKDENFSAKVVEDFASKWSILHITVLQERLNCSSPYAGQQLYHMITSFCRQWSGRRGIFNSHWRRNQRAGAKHWREKETHTKAEENESKYLKCYARAMYTLIILRSCCKILMARKKTHYYVYILVHFWLELMSRSCSHQNKHSTSTSVHIAGLVERCSRR